MELDGTIEAVAEDLRRAGAVGGAETARVAELLVAAVEPTLRLHLLEALHAAARELEASAPGVTVEIRLEARDPVMSLVRSGPGSAGGEEPGEAASAVADGELLRLTIRLPEGLKSCVEQAAAAAGASINSWIVTALVRAIDAPAAGWPHVNRRLPRRMTGFVQG